jgi:hypothetical protein
MPFGVGRPLVVAARTYEALPDEQMERLHG